jgi:hypothetical protein
MGEKNENNQIDAGMAAALSPTTAENYLGDPKVVEWLLRNYSNQCIQRRSQMLDDRMGSAQLDVDDAKKVADILLGKNESFKPIESWNKPGVIDLWLVDEFQPPKEMMGSPESVVECAIVTFLMHMYKLMVAIEDMPDDDAQMSVDALVQQFTWLLMGSPEWNKSE